MACTTNQSGMFVCGSGVPTKHRKRSARPLRSCLHTPRCFVWGECIALRRGQITIHRTTNAKNTEGSNG